MPFLRSLKQTAPGYPADIPWPIHGLAYVITFMGPLSGGIVAGLITGTGLGVLVGLIVGAMTTLAHAWLSDTFIDAWIAKFQASLNHTTSRVFLNVVAILWAIALCAISMLATWAILIRVEILPR
jgi:hypothetical protein